MVNKERRKGELTVVARGSREAHKLDKLHLHRHAGVASDVVMVRDESRRLKKPPGSRLNARKVVVARDVSRGSRLNAREVVVARYVSRRIEKSGCGSHLDVRDVVVGSMLEEGKKTPPARI